jgi:hypothetical protein
MRGGYHQRRNKKKRAQFFSFEGQKLFTFKVVTMYIKPLPIFKNLPPPALV